MSRDIIKYYREQEIKNDTLQSKFTINGNLEKSTKKIKEVKVRTDMIVYCPFCLLKAKLNRFLITDSKGELSTYRAKCPECKNGMLFKTIISMYSMNEAKVRSYARWVNTYRRGFWRKVKKDMWDKRLKRYGFAGYFWTEYKKVKATLVRPSEEDIDNGYTQTREEYLKQKEKEYKEE